MNNIRIDDHIAQLHFKGKETTVGGRRVGIPYHYGIGTLL